MDFCSLEGLTSILTATDRVHRPPEHYDQPRDDVELELAKEFIQLGKPILAICRGFQMINVALGGVLLQDIPTWCGADHSGGLRHSVELIPGSKLSSWFGTEIEVNSYHHQGIRVEELAPPLRLSAFWESNEQKIVEGYEHPSLPILGSSVGIRNGCWRTPKPICLYSSGGCWRTRIDNYISRCNMVSHLSK